MKFEKQVLDLAIEIQQIPSPTFHEQNRAQFVLEKFKEEGLEDISIDKINNVYARLPGKGDKRPIIISAHLDTVFPIETDLTTRKKGNKVLGPGLGDNSLGVAGLFGLLWSIRSQDFQLPGDIWFVANSCEEGLGDLKGMREIAKKFGSSPIAYLVLEGMGQGNIYHKGLGVRRFHISAKTMGGHSWVDYGSPSAIHELVTLIQKLLEIKLPKDPKTSMNVGKIIGGTSINTIASEASFHLDLRSEKEPELNDLVAQVRKTVKDSEYSGLQFEVEKIGDRPAGGLSKDHPLVKLAEDVIKNNGGNAKLIVGSTDANIPLSMDLPAICIGLTAGGRAHSKDDFILLDPLQKGLTQLEKLIIRIFSDL